MVTWPGEEVAPKGWQGEASGPGHRVTMLRGHFSLFSRAAGQCKHHPFCLKRGDKEEGRTTPGLPFLFVGFGFGFLAFVLFCCGGVF